MATASNLDFRISVGFFEHPKTVKLERRLGEHAVLCHTRLFRFTAQFRPSGVLSNMSAEDIEIAAGFKGELGAYVAACVDIRLLDILEDGTYEVHDWADHNPWAFEAEVRSEHARAASNARWAKQREGTSNAGGTNEHSGEHERGMPLSYPNHTNAKNTPLNPPASGGTANEAEGKLPADARASEPAAVVEGPVEGIAPADWHWDAHPEGKTPRLLIGLAQESACARFCRQYKTMLKKSYAVSDGDNAALGRVLWRHGSVMFDAALVAFLACTDKFTAETRRHAAGCFASDFHKFADAAAEQAVPSRASPVGMVELPKEVQEWQRTKPGRDWLEFKHFKGEGFDNQPEPPPPHIVALAKSVGHLL